MHQVSFDLCAECSNNLDWWMQKIDVNIPTISGSAPPIEPENVIQELPNENECTNTDIEYLTGPLKPSAIET